MHNDVTETVHGSSNDVISTPSCTANSDAAANTNGIALYIYTVYFFHFYLFVYIFFSLSLIISSANVECRFSWTLIFRKVASHRPIRNRTMIIDPLNIKPKSQNKHRQIQVTARSSAVAVIADRTAHDVLTNRFLLQVDGRLVHDPIQRVEFMNAPKLYLLKRDHWAQHTKFGSVVHKISE